MKKTPWIYDTNEALNTRYTLGVEGSRMIAIVGANPSTARPGTPDRTVRRIQQFVLKMGYDGYVLCNLWPEVETHPEKLRKRSSGNIQRANRQMISFTLQRYPIVTFWAAWGNIIATRKYLRSSLLEIGSLPECQANPWIQVAPPTMKGHPRHPLYCSSSSTMMPFDLNTYIHALK